MPRSEAIKVIRETLSAGGKILLEHDAKALLSACGLEVPKSVYIKDEKELVAALEALSLPVVLKVVSSNILHKSDVGGVVTGLNSHDDVRDALTEMRRSVREDLPDAVIEGFLLEETAPEGVEVIVGGLRDNQFGPAIMFGIGGITVELLKDVSYRIAPVTREEALEMIREVMSYPLLTGFRGTKPVNMDKLADAVVKISEMITEIEEIGEIEINPLIATVNGAIAVDAKVVLAEKW